MANTVLALNLLPSMRASSAWAKGRMRKWSRLATRHSLDPWRFALSAFGSRLRLVAQLGAAQAFDLAGAGHRPFDQAAVEQEILHRGEARDLADLVEDGQAEVLTDGRHGLQSA